MPANITQAVCCMVADAINDRVILVNPRLQFEGLVKIDKCKNLGKIRKLCFNENLGLIFVGLPTVESMYTKCFLKVSVTGNVVHQCSSSRLNCPYFTASIAHRREAVIG